MKPANRKAVAATIKSARLSQGLTQQQLADAAGTTQNVISKVESAYEALELSWIRAIRIAQALGADAAVVKLMENDLGLARHED